MADFRFLRTHFFLVHPVGNWLRLVWIEKIIRDLRKSDQTITT